MQLGLLTDSDFSQYLYQKFILFKISTSYLEYWKPCQSFFNFSLIPQCFGKQSFAVAI